MFYIIRLSALFSSLNIKKINLFSIGIVSISKLKNMIDPVIIKMRYSILDESCKLLNDVFAEFIIQMALYMPPTINTSKKSNNEILKR